MANAIVFSVKNSLLNRLFRFVGQKHLLDSTTEAVVEMLTKRSLRCFSDSRKVIESRE